jgi:gas vesicle protein
MRHEESGFSAGSVLLAFLLGGMVGAGLSLLLAPQAGTETRKRIREFADDVKEKATDYAGQAKEKVISNVDKAKGMYEVKKSALTAAIEAGKEAYEKEVTK